MTRRSFAWLFGPTLTCMFALPLACDAQGDSAQAAATPSVKSEAPPDSLPSPPPEAPPSSGVEFVQAANSIIAAREAAKTAENAAIQVEGLRESAEGRELTKEELASIRVYLTKQRDAEAKQKAHLDAARLVYLSRWSTGLTHLASGLMVAKTMTATERPFSIVNTSPSPLLVWSTRAMEGLSAAGLLWGARESSKESGDPETALTVAASSFALKFLGDEILGKRASLERSNPPSALAVFAEKVALYNAFRNDVLEARASVRSVLGAMSPSIELAKAVESSPPEALKNQKVTKDMADRYRAAISSYDEMVGLLSSIERRATSLLADTTYDWTAKGREDLTDIQEASRSALEWWKYVVQSSDDVLAGLQALEEADREASSQARP